MKYGRLTVLKTYRANGETFAHCICDCGNEKEARLADIKRAKNPSCGCARVKDLSGKKFGKLTIVGKYPKKINGHFKWECKCECGNTTYVKTSSLLYGNTKSCGCEITAHAKKMVNDSQEGTRRGSLVRGTRKNSYSGVTGVSWNSKRCQFEAYISAEGKKKLHLGWFDNKEDAVKARKEAEKKYYDPLIEEIEISGVHKLQNGKWRAVIRENLKTKSLGVFETREEAVEARKEAEKNIFANKKG